MTAPTKVPGWRKARKLPLVGDEGPAANRLKDLDLIARHRTESGIFSEPHGWLRVVCDALAVLGSQHHQYRAFARKILLEGIGAPDGEYLSSNDVELALDSAHHRDRPMGNRTAGREIGLLLAELEAIRKKTGRTLSLYPLDETSEERDDRIARQKTEGNASRKREQRSRDRAKRVTPVVTLPAKRVTSDVTFAGSLTEKVTPKVTKPVTLLNTNTQRDRDGGAVKPDGAPSLVQAAIAAGCTHTAEIIRATGCSDGAVKMALSRLSKRGTILRTVRGRYAPATQSQHEPASEAIRPALIASGERARGRLDRHHGSNATKPKRHLHSTTHDPEPAEPDYEADFDRYVRELEGSAPSPGDARIDDFVYDPFEMQP